VCVCVCMCVCVCVSHWPGHILVLYVVGFPGHLFALYVVGPNSLLICIEIELTIQPSSLTMGFANTSKVFAIFDYNTMF